MGQTTPSHLDEASDPSRRLRWRYLVTLTVMAVFVVSGTLTILLLIGLLTTDPPAINEAGRQRMLSQRFTKDVLRLRHATSPKATRDSLGYLNDTMEAWAQGHERLWREVEGPTGLFSDRTLRAALVRVDSPYRSLREAGRQLLAAFDSSIGDVRDRDAVEQAVDRILDQEPSYLAEMDRMVSLYEAKASSRVESLRRAAMLFTLASVLLLAASGLFILEPAIRLIRRQFLTVRALLEDAHDAKHQLEARNRFIQDIFGRYVDDEVVERLLNSPGGLDLGGEERKATLLMSDLRGFTSLTSTLPPRKAVQLLNGYLDCMTKVVEDYGGMVCDFLGDCVFAVFGAPIAYKDDARRAVACALSMQLELEGVNDTFEEAGLPRLKFGIGIHTGSVIAGNVGSVRRAKYGVVGAAVNLTSRLEDCALAGQLLISEATFKEVGGEAEVVNRLTFKVKGFEETVEAYELTGLKGPPQIKCIANDEPLLALREGFPVSYRRVDGDQVGDLVFRGEIAALSSEQVEIDSITVDDFRRGSNGSNSVTSYPLVPMVGIREDIELSLSPSADRILATTVCAKVTETVGGKDTALRARFTSVSPAARAIIDGLLESTSQTSRASANGTDSRAAFGPDPGDPHAPRPPEPTAA